MFRVKHNGPAVCFSRCYPTQHPGRILVPRASGARRLSRCKERLRQGFGVQRRVWRAFCRHGTNFIEHWCDRGTRFLSGWEFIPVVKLVKGTGAISRYKFFRSQKIVKVQDFNCGQLCESGCRVIHLSR